MKFIILIGLVAVVMHHANGQGCGCSGGTSSLHHHSYGSYGRYHDEHHRHGCGFPFPRRKECTREELPQSDWCDKDTNKDCVPLVVRPHDIPKPPVHPEVECELSQVVPNPCAVKKAIVKPAVLPKPVCQHSHQNHHFGCSGSHGCHHGHGGHTCCGSLCGAGPCYGHGHYLNHPGLIGVHGVRHVVGHVGHDVHGTGHTGPYARGGLGPLAPADAVSLDIAYKLAKEADVRKIQSEDKLHFGFRKIPIELPPKKVVQANVPEEGIFHLNGQVLELKPVKPSAGSSPAALAEEAAEQLMTLEEEEAEILANEGPEGLMGLQPPIRKVSLCEIGYGVAKPPKPNLVEIPASKATGDVSTHCGCGHYGHHHGCGGYACGHIGGCASCGHKCDCKIILGDVEFETKPKPQQICLPPPVVPDDCESAEVELEKDCHEQIKCACVPVCVKHHHCDHSCKKTCVTIEKLLT